MAMDYVYLVVEHCKECCDYTNNHLAFRKKEDAEECVAKKTIEIAAMSYDERGNHRFFEIDEIELV